MEKEIIVEPVELTEAERKAAEEAKKAFGKILKKAFKRAPVADCGIFAEWYAKSGSTKEQDDAEE